MKLILKALPFITAGFVIGAFILISGQVPSSAQSGSVQYLSIPASAFIPSNSDVDYSFDSLVNLSTTPAILSSIFHAPVYLPNGARVVSMKAWVDAPTTDANARITLCSRNFRPQAGGCNGHISISNEGSEGDVEIGTEADVLIQNSFQSYFIRAMLDANTLLGTVQLEYLEP